ncbi:RNA methyltransferase [Halioxenophilus aromaticivorans]|uniref:RNA methyltransferase n=1 Tax=Halioxenophilus aromaticivorans TaxID=1306992 RepID=A0AAV3TVP7_9ALTE
MYGRKPVLEALQTAGVKAFRLHLAQTNKQAAILEQIEALASQQGAEICYHSRAELSRISKNSKQDQGVCADMVCPGFADLDHFIEHNQNRAFELIALDKITNPQNLGMIIRSVAAGFCDGLLLPEKGSAQIDPLVIKASAGTVFKAKILRCPDLPNALAKLQSIGAKVACLAGDGDPTFANIDAHKQRVFVLGNETDGVSAETNKASDYRVAIPMNNGVESLNVAVTASLLAYRKHLQ